MTDADFVKLENVAVTYGRDAAHADFRIHQRRRVLHHVLGEMGGEAPRVGIHQQGHGFSCRIDALHHAARLDSLAVVRAAEKPRRHHAPGFRQRLGPDHAQRLRQGTRKRNDWLKH